MRKIILVLVLSGLFIFSASQATAQYENTSGQKQEGEVKKRQKPPREHRWFTGGMIGAGFSSVSSYVEVSPLIGYKVTPAFHVGTRFTYIWNSLLRTPDEREQLHHFGMSFFSRYVIWRGLFAHAEFETLSLDQIVTDRYWVNSLFLGGGYLQSIGGRGFMSFAVLFNVLDDEKSPYVNPIIRIGFGVGF